MPYFQATSIAGCFRFQLNPRFQDERGFFTKPLHLDFLKQHGIAFECRESFISFSHQGVLRGMHFQIPPFAHEKIVSCIDGEIADVIVDLRRSSPSFGKAESFSLSGASGDAIFVPVGCAHGFQVTSKAGAWVAYYTSKEHHAESDRGVHWESVPVKWPLPTPIVSVRDQGFAPMQESSFFE